MHVVMISEFEYKYIYTEIMTIHQANIHLLANIDQANDKTDVNK